jgi:hypothetical protein
VTHCEHSATYLGNYESHRLKLAEVFARFHLSPHLEEQLRRVHAFDGHALGCKRSTALSPWVNPRCQQPKASPVSQTFVMSSPL